MERLDRNFIIKKSNIRSVIMVVLVLFILNLVAFVNSLVAIDDDWDVLHP